jgi:hypothetical protein
MVMYALSKLDANNRVKDSPAQDHKRQYRHERQKPHATERFGCPAAPRHSRHDNAHDNRNGADRRGNQNGV